MYYNNGPPDNGLCINGRSTVIYWHCDQNANQNDVNMQAFQLDTCDFQIDLYTNDACAS